VNDVLGCCLHKATKNIRSALQDVGIYQFANTVMYFQIVVLYETETAFVIWSTPRYDTFSLN